MEFKQVEQGLHCYLDMSENGETIQLMLMAATTADEEDVNEDEGEDDPEDESENNPEDHEENEPEDKESKESKDYVLVNTVQGNFEGFTKHNFRIALEARRLQGMIGNPTKQEFSRLVCEKFIANCPVSVRNVQNANYFFCPDLEILRGKIMRTKPEHVRVDYVKIPPDLMELHKYVTIVADVMFLNGLQFLVTSSRGISLITINFLSSRTAKYLTSSVNRV